MKYTNEEHGVQSKTLKCFLAGDPTNMSYNFKGANGINAALSGSIYSSNVENLTLVWEKIFF